MAMEHVTIYREQGRYAGWPANYGMWVWDNEIVLVFTAGYHLTGSGFHTRDRNRPFSTLQARSIDGGKTWQVGAIPCRIPGNRALSADEHVNQGLRLDEVLDGTDAPGPPPGGFDFSQPDFAIMCARTGLRAGSRSFFYYSVDRCQRWQGPFLLPTFDQPGIAARTDYIIRGPQECLLFLTAAKRNGDEGRVFCAHTKDGGSSFRFRSWIGPEPEGFSIMPASVCIGHDHILVAVRRCGKPVGYAAIRHWIDLYVSTDAGASWTFLCQPVSETGAGGNPPALTKLSDGRLCLTYGYRSEPFGIRARLSRDGGNTWGRDISLREDGGCHDLGYPRTVQRPDGVLVTAYYFNDEPDRERYIAATLWRP
jgi:hypothetical protein